MTNLQHKVALITGAAEVSVLQLQKDLPLMEQTSLSPINPLPIKQKK